MDGVTLVLGGGGFKGLAHLGVLVVLQENDVPIERVVGTSVGALVGASYCHSGDARVSLEAFSRFLRSPSFPAGNFSALTRDRHAASNGSWVHRVVSGIKRQVALERMFRRSSGFGGTALRHIVSQLLPKTDIRELRIPLAVCALDLMAGDEIMISEGHLQSAVVAAGSVPGFFPPVEREGRLLCDAGIVNNLPTQMARTLGAKRVLAVDLSSELARWDGKLLGLIGTDVLFRAQDISARIANQRWSQHADIVLRPDLEGRTWLDAHDPPAIIQAGADAALAALPAIHDLLGRQAVREA